MRSFAEDYKMGTKSEVELVPVFNKHFDDVFVRGVQKAVLDFQGKKSYIELKTRTNALWDFPTTLLPYNKVAEALRKSKPTYFVFAFTDCIGYILFDKELFDTFATGDFCRKPRSDYSNKPAPYIWIPVNLLSILEV